MKLRTALGLLVVFALSMSMFAIPHAVNAAGTFTDDDGSTFEADIEWLAAEGITKGCNPPTNDRFCPDDFVTRGQMAAFLHRALDDILTPGSPVEFIDDDGNTFESDIEWLGATGVTKGCNPPTNNRYCPDDNVTRGQMAAFLHRALEDVLTPGSPVEFIDDDGNTFESDIEWLGATGVTKGCNPPTNDRFCPDDNVTRGQMAAFLRRALEGPPSDTTTTTSSGSTSSSTGSSSTSSSTTTTSTPPAGDAEWIEIDDGAGPQARHENGFVTVGDRLYLIGGRNIRDIEYFDLATGQWVDTSVNTVDLHHFQPVVIGTDIYIVGALTGPCCTADQEVPVDVVKVFDTDTNTLTDTHSIPPDFQRGSAGAVVYKGDIYIVSGNTGGHGDVDGSDITQNLDLFTKYDPDAPPASRWTELDPIPHERDHFSAAVIGDRLYVAGGRTSEVAFGNPMFAAVVPEVDVYDFDTGNWSTVTMLPSPRAASPTTALGGALYVIGGEGGSMSSPMSDAWDDVHRLVPSSPWSVLEPIPIPRHGTGAAVCGGDIYVAAGATTRGGSSETDAFHALDTAGDGLDCLP